MYILIYENYLFPFAQFVGTSQQHVDTVRTNDANDNRTDRADNPTRVMKCIWHGQDSGAQ